MKRKKLRKLARLVAIQIREDAARKAAEKKRSELIDKCDAILRSGKRGAAK